MKYTRKRCRLLKCINLINSNLNISWFSLIFCPIYSRYMFIHFFKFKFYKFYKFYKRKLVGIPT